MARIKFSECKQSEFLNKINKRYNVGWPKVAKICRVHHRTLFDWRRDKYQMSYAALQLLKNRLRIPTAEIQVFPDDWNIKKAARLGALRHNELYGNPGTLEGRRRGGTVSALKFRTNPEFAKKVGFKLRKQIIYPRKSPLLAEFIGILLGDGSITESQVRIYNNNKTDRNYAYFIKEVIADLFKVTATVTVRDKNTIIVTASSRNFVKIQKFNSYLGEVA